MSSEGLHTIHTIVEQTIARRTIQHEQHLRSDVAAIITVESDTRFFPYTLSKVLSQTVLPETVIIADCTGQISQPMRMMCNVNNAATTETIAIQVIGLEHARSFGEAITMTLRANPLIDSQLVWMLHDDSRPGNDVCLEKLLETWEMNPTASIIGAKQMDWDQHALQEVGYYATNHHHVTSLVVDGEPDQEQYDGRKDVYAVSLAGAIISMKTLRTLGTIDSWFSTYSEGIDLCRRIVMHGGRVIVSPRAIIAHRRARYEGVRTKSGSPREIPKNTSMNTLSGARKYWYTDHAAWTWPLLWLMSLITAPLQAIRSLFRKKPYEAWCHICMPWIQLINTPWGLAARHRVTRQTRVSRRELAPLYADSQQIRQFKDRVDAFEQQQTRTAINPLAQQHLRARRIQRWSFVLIAALLAGIVVAVTYFDILRSCAEGSLYSQQLIPTGASFKQLVDAATTPWVFGQGTGVPAPPMPWLMVLMVASLITCTHVSAALALIFFLAAPGCVLSMWILAGVVTRSDTVRVLAGLLWFAAAMAFGFFSSANLAMLTVMVFLPAAFACSFRAVGMYRTEEPLIAQSSVQKAAIAGLLFMPVVASEPQFIIALIIIFVSFLVFVRRHRMMLLLIPLPSAVLLAPTLMNSIRYAHLGMWRQLFGDIMLPTAQYNPNPQVNNLSTLAMRMFSMDTTGTVNSISSSASFEQIAMLIIFSLLVLLALVSLLKPSIFRVTRIMWTVIICGLLLATVSGSITIAVQPYGPASGSIMPGIVLAMMGVICCVCILAGSAVQQFVELKAQRKERSISERVGRVSLCSIMIIASFFGIGYGIHHMNDGGVAITQSSLPMIAQDYLSRNQDSRILALAATSDNEVSYNVMHTSRGDLIDSSAVQRVRQALHVEVNPENDKIARLSARLLANNDSDAIDELESLGFGGIYVVSSDNKQVSTKASERLSLNIAASDKTENVVSNDSGTYYRLVSPETITINTDWQRRTQSNSWRIAWLWTLGILIALYGIVSIPRSRSGQQEEEV